MNTLTSNTLTLLFSAVLALPALASEQPGSAQGSVTAPREGTAAPVEQATLQVAEQETSGKRHWPTSPHAPKQD
ncbi:hypothetical protein A9179_01655 [Pseudomonas alcaligenes]|uniref:Uncharacterized protein n=1 Tax=Aquipseudomonas alcaligenes TaxID=43263 RepID=A0ABR7RXD3_AQUAC|nr:hypothetical protein [Pseudomonas alcaligenes]MBC9248971.1 hypothetical protein [Pseudomonas alcaligenes]